MTLSIASNAAGRGKPFGYGPAGLPPLASVPEAAQQPGAAASWSYAPPPAGTGRRDARISGLLAVLSNISADSDATAKGRTSQSVDDVSGSMSSSPARSDAPDLLQALNDAAGAPVLPAVLPLERSGPEQSPRPVQVLARRQATDIMSALRIGPSTQDGPADPSISAADAQLQALFKTLQAYGL